MTAQETDETMFSVFVTQFLERVESAKNTVNSGEQYGSAIPIGSILDKLFADVVGDLAIAMREFDESKESELDHSFLQRGCVQFPKRPSVEPIEIIELDSDDEDDAPEDSEFGRTTFSKDLQPICEKSTTQKQIEPANNVFPFVALQELANGGDTTTNIDSHTLVNLETQDCNNDEEDAARNLLLGEKFPTRADVHLHHQSQHIRTPSSTRKGLKIHMCPAENCGKSFCNVSHLREHQISHQTFKPFRCKWPSCKFSTKYRSNAREHIKKRHLKGRSLDLLPQYLEVVNE